jgi:hypothetical protein
VTESTEWRGNRDKFDQFDKCLRSIRQRSSFRAKRGIFLRCWTNLGQTERRVTFRDCVLGRRQRSKWAEIYFSRSFAYFTGTARFDPPNPFNIAKLTPITFPLRLKSGPPEPPEVVAAS